MNIQNLIVQSIDDLFRDNIRVAPAIRKRFSVSTWVHIKKNPRGSYEGRVSSAWIPSKDARYICSVSTCPEGSWSYFANFGVFDDHIKLSLKTPVGILRHVCSFEYRVFNFCDPDFPDNFVGFLKQAATNANACFELANRRTRARWNRDF